MRELGEGVGLGNLYRPSRWASYGYNPRELMSPRTRPWVFIFSNVTLRENQFHRRNEQLDGTLSGDLVADAKQLRNHWSRFNL